MVSRTSILAAALATPLMASVALAAGPEPTPAPEPVPMAPVPMAPMASDWTGGYVGGSLGYADVSGEGADGDAEADGLTYGLHAGYDYDFGGFVLGGELEISGFDVSEDDFGLDVDRVARAKLRAGYNAGNFMPYVTVGAAQLKASSSTDSFEDTGSVYGLGVDYKFSDRIRVGGELLKHDFDDFDGTDIDVDATTATARVSFQF